MKKGISAVALALVTSACVTESDPTKGGLFGGLHGLSTGAYARGVETRKARLQALKKATSQMQDENRALDKQRMETSARRAAVEAELTSLRDELEHLRARNKAKVAESVDVRARRDQLARELKTLQEQEREIRRSLADVKQKEKQLDELKNKRDLLLSIYQDLLL